MINAIVGFLTGLAASLGLGGGFILIIYLTIFTQTSQLEAQGINLLFFLPIAIFSLFFHTRNKLVKWRSIPLICGVGAIGVGVGTLLANNVDSSILNKMFALLLIYVGIKETFHKNTLKNKSEKTLDK